MSSHGVSRTGRPPAAALLLAAGLAAAVASCRDLPPRIPAGYVGSRPPGAAWPAPAAYDPDPLHPWNRWFQRTFGARDHGGELVAASPSRPLPETLDPDAVDRAEMIALLAGGLREEGLTADSAPEYRDPISASILVADLLQVSLSLADRADSGGEDSRLIEAVVDAARRIAERHPPREDVVASIAQPPPLRSGAWLELPPPETAGLAPTARDIRWTRIACSDSPWDGAASIVLLRLRVAVGARREAVLLPIADECWEVVISGDEDESARTRLWRFDRALWTLGKDPWIASEAEDGLAGEQLEILADGVAPVASGLVPATFRGAPEGARPADGGAGDDADGEVPVEPFAAILGAAWKAGQRERVGRILEEVLWRKLATDVSG